MIEMAIIAMIVSSVTLRVAGNVAVDGFFAARGMESPRLAGARKRRPRGAASRYWGEVWDDAWTGASAKRAARRADPSSPSRPRGAATSFWAGWLQDRRQATRRRWNEGWTRADERRREKASRPRPGQVTVPGTVVPNAQDDSRPQDEDRPEPRPVPTEDDQDEPTDPIQQDGDQSVPDSVPDYVPDFGPDNDPSSPVMPTTEGTTTMTTTTGEVTGLDTAIRFCEDSARGYQAQSHQIELAMASLNAAEATAVAGPLAVATEMTEAAAKAMKEAEMELRKQLPIAELYRANPGAATKDFMLQG